LANEYLKAANDIERIITTVWEKNLKLDGIGTEDSFFDLGGNSLLALKILAQLKQEHQLDISIVKMFQYPTIKAMASYLDNSNNQLDILKKRLSKKTQSGGDIAIIAMNGVFSWCRQY
jgi:acyl carrier protein